MLVYQIVRTQSDTLHEKMIRSTALGLKDTATSVTAVWDKLFRTPSKKRQKGIEEAIGDRYVSPLVKDISTCGEYDKLAQSKCTALSLLLNISPCRTAADPRHGMPRSQPASRATSRSSRPQTA